VERSIVVDIIPVVSDFCVLNESYIMSMEMALAKKEILILGLKIDSRKNYIKIPDSNLGIVQSDFGSLLRNTTAESTWTKAKKLRSIL